MPTKKQNKAFEETPLVRAVSAMADDLASAKSDAIKTVRGNLSAGARLRKTLLAVGKDTKKIRADVQTTLRELDRL